MITAFIIYYFIAGFVMVGWQAENFNTDENNYAPSAQVFAYVSMGLFGFITVWIAIGRKLFRSVTD